MLIADFKKQFNQGSSYIHFNNSGQAPIPRVYQDTMSHWLEKFYSEGAFTSQEGWNEVEKVRHTLADFIGAKAAEVAFMQTTASAISQAALSIPFQSGDQILTWQQEYPSNFYPWRIAAEKNGAEVIQIPTPNFETPVDQILEKVTDKTKAIALSWVQYQTGAITDLKKLSSALQGRDIWLVADVIQGVGVREFNFRDSGFDIICCGSHKWLCSGYGGAFMAIQKDRLHTLNPLEYGAMTFGDPDTLKSFTLEPKKTAHRFEPGSKSMLEIIAMQASLQLFQKVGLKNIENEAERLASILRKGLIELGFQVFAPHSGTIISWSYSAQQTNNIAAANQNKAEYLKQQKVSFAVRGPGVRFSLHAFNTDAEVEQVLKLMAAPVG